MGPCGRVGALAHLYKPFPRMLLQAGLGDNCSTIAAEALARGLSAMTLPNSQGPSLVCRANATENPRDSDGTLVKMNSPALR
jgi:hypothetical protein